MMQTIYWLVHKDSQERVRSYRTLQGARIAQRARNHRLGFTERIERIELVDNWEVERCRCTDNQILEATYVIVEDYVTIELEELIDNGYEH
jgi:hypothetical protein